MTKKVIEIDYKRVILKLNDNWYCNLKIQTVSQATLFSFN